MQKKYTLIISLLCYVASIATYALRGVVNGEPIFGIELLIGGAFGILFSAFIYVWYWLANPIYFLAIYFTAVGKTTTASIMALISIVIMLSFLFVLRTPTGRDFMTEAVNIEIGYIFWVAAGAILLVGNIILRSQSR